MEPTPQNSHTLAHPKHAHVRRVLFIVAIIFIFIAVVIFAIDTALANGFAWNGAFPKSGTQLEFTNTGTPELFSFGQFSRIYSEGSLAAFAKAPVKVLEAVPYTDAPGAYVVLALVPGESGDVLGILTKDNKFTPVIEDGTAKSDLAVRPDGYALYTVAETWADVTASSTGDQTIIINPSAPITDAEIAAQASKLGGTPSTQKQGTPPVHAPTSLAAAPVIPANAASRLKLVNLQLTNPTVIDLGIGRSSRLAADVFFIALTPNGLVRIDPVMRAVTLILPRMNADQSGAEISPDGTTIALPGGRGTQFFSITHTSPANLTLLGTVALPLVPLSFVDDTHVVSLISATNAFIFAVPNSATTIQTPKPLGLLHLITGHPFFTL